MSNFKNKIEINKKYGKLTVKEKVWDEKVKETRYKCICDCGKNTLASGTQLNKGTKISCGCAKRDLCTEKLQKYFVGDKFNKLTIISFPKQTEKVRIANCICDCGNIKNNITIKQLASEGVTSCGCNRRSNDPWNDVYERYKKDNAVYRNIDFKLTREEFEYLCKDNCYYCNKQPEINATSYLKRNGIDRKDSLKGYTNENSVSCCSICNKLKNNLSIYRFMEIIKLIYNFYYLKNYITDSENIKKEFKFLSVKTTDPFITEFKRMQQMNKRRKYGIKNINLTFDEFKILSQGNCFYCGREPHILTHVGRSYRNTIDRVDNNLHYDIDNCVTACWICNKMKHTHTQTEFLTQIKCIFNNLRSKNLIR
jgi:hypothetical protein